MPDRGDAIEQRSREPSVTHRCLYDAPRRVPLLHDDYCQAETEDKADRLFQQIMRDVGQPEQQPDFPERVAEHGDKREATDPEHQVGGGGVAQMEEPQAMLTGRQQHAGDTKHGGAHGI